MVKRTYPLLPTSVNTAAARVAKSDGVSLNLSFAKTGRRFSARQSSTGDDARGFVMSDAVQWTATAPDRIGSRNELRAMGCQTAPLFNTAGPQRLRGLPFVAVVKTADFRNRD